MDPIEEQQKSLLRSVDCLQRFNALVLGLSTVEAFKRLVEFNRQFPLYPAELHWELLPNLVSFIFMVGPLYHGMHRHLDAAFGELQSPAEKRKHQGFFLFDFILSWVTFFLIFILQVYIAVIPTFVFVLSCICAANVLWGIVISRFTSRAHVIYWVILDLGFAVGIWIFMIWSNRPLAQRSEMMVSVIVACLCVGRAIIDYAGQWEFYFPAHPGNATTRKGNYAHYEESI